VNHLGLPPRAKSTKPPFRVRPYGPKDRKVPQMAHELPDVIEEQLRQSAFGFLSGILRSSTKWLNERLRKIR